LDELYLIKQCKQQVRQAQKQLYEAYYPSAYRLSRRYLSGSHDAEDVLISAFIRIFRHISEFDHRGEGSLQKWINTIVINECIRFLSRYRPVIAEEDLSSLVAEKEWYQDDSGYDAEEILQIMDQMPDGYRTVFNLFAIEGYSHPEIAGMLNIREGTSKSQLSKARNFLIERLNRKKSYGIK
jgi:RNA polymerase sigma-70 factor (ECF subfamily)